ncbi:hypothetical protein JXD38_08845 [candidate division WOR-3 bacterium]|nr:hypothetical protein [candidate division WOR-3 bacterium]
MAQLTAYLDSGHPVYAEGGDFGYSNATSELWPYFGASYLGDGQPSSTGNVQSLNGEAGTLAEGMGLTYLYQQEPDNYVDELGSDGGTVVVRSQENIGRVVCNETPTYRTVLSATIFGASSGADREALLAGFMDYLLPGTGIGQNRTLPQPAGAALVPSVARVGRGVRLETSGPARELRVLDVSGRTLAEWRLPAGGAAAVWHIGPDVAPGAYFLQVRAAGRSDTHPFTVVR